MNNELAFKVYDIDYSFLIKNYLAPELWDKSWTLFVYKNIRVQLDMSSIEVKRPRRICFKISINEGDYYRATYITHDMENSNFEVLKRQINGSIRDLIGYLEDSYIRKEEGYRQLERNKSEEKDILRRIAEDYLNDNGITLDDVREAYISKYVYDNCKGDVYTSNYLSGRRYKSRPDVWLVYYKIIGDDTKLKAIEQILLRDDRFKDILQEISEYNIIMEADEDTAVRDEYVNDMTLLLEGI